MKSLWGTNEKMIAGLIFLAMFGIGEEILRRGVHRWLIISLLGLIGVVAIVVGLIKARVRSRAPKPVLQAQSDDRPGTFTAYGVNPSTKLEGKWQGAADSALSARIKAEREGWIIGRVDREL